MGFPGVKRSVLKDRQCSAEGDGPDDEGSNALRKVGKLLSDSTQLAFPCLAPRHILIKLSVIMVKTVLGISRAALSKEEILHRI